MLQKVTILRKYHTNVYTKYDSVLQNVKKHVTDIFKSFAQYDDSKSHVEIKQS